MSAPFKVLGINHIGIAAKSPDLSAKLFSLLNLEHLGDELVAEQKTNTRMYSTGPADDSRLELLLNQEGEEGPIKKFLETRGGGIHHVALSVDNVAAALSYLEEQGVQLIDRLPRKGAHNTGIGFIHPKAAGGILIELVQQL